MAAGEISFIEVFLLNKRFLYFSVLIISWTCTSGSLQQYIYQSLVSNLGNSISPPTANFKLSVKRVCYVCVWS